MDFGVIPIENSWAGSIVENSDLLAECDVWIEGETKVAVNHCLIVNKNVKNLKLLRQFLILKRYLNVLSILNLIK